MLFRLLKYFSIIHSCWSIVAVYVFFNVLWLVLLGAHFSLESEKYIGQAEQLLLNGKFTEQRFIFYSSTIFVIAFALKYQLGLYGAMVCIMFINLCSYLYLFRSLQSLFQKKWVPLVFISFLLSFWPYQSWSVYLYSECLFYSSVQLLLAHLILFRTWTVKYLAILILILLFVLISRPLGVLFIVPILVFSYFNLARKHKAVFFIVLVVSAWIMNAIVQSVFTTTSDWSLQKVMQEGDLICNIPNRSINANVKTTQNPSQLYQLFYFVVYNFSYFINLAGNRLMLFFTLTRSYYSFFHNAYLVIIVVPLYLLILSGMKRIKNTLPLPIFLFMIFTIVFFAAAIALQCDDYHNRFFLTLMPILTLLTAARIVRTTEIN